MPMSRAFEKRLFPKLPKIIEYFGTPFHILDEQEIIDTGNNLKQSLIDVKDFKEFFAVKALPTSAILRIMKKLGFGLDCRLRGINAECHRHRRGLLGWSCDSLG